jgi:hypothetical protein
MLRRGVSLRQNRALPAVRKIEKDKTTDRFW